jgi:hypothetical protein
VITPDEALTADLAKRYWDVANAIVGFSVVQMLAFLYPLAHKEFRTHVVRAYWGVIAGVVVSWGMYTSAVLSCHSAEIRLLGAGIPPDAFELFRYTMYARVAIITIYSLLGITVLLVGKFKRWE